MNQYIPGYTEEPVLARVGQKIIITNDEGKILMLRRSSKSDRAGGWDFAGGRLELGENPYDGVAREIREETGLEVKDMQPIDVYSYFNNGTDFVVIIGYQAKWKSGEVKLSWEHDLYQWMTESEVEKLDLPPAHRSFFEHIRK